MADSTQIERQLYILSSLSDSRNGMTIDEIRHDLEIMGYDVSRKTVRRDIDYISMGNFNVAEESRGAQTYYIANKFGLDNISFTISEMLSLYFTREILKNYSSLDVAITAKKLIDNIIDKQLGINIAFIDGLRDYFMIDAEHNIFPDKVVPEIVSDIKSAIQNQFTIRIKYHSFNQDKVTERECDPYFIEISEGCYHLIGHCHLRNEIRNFRVSRIASVKILDKKYNKEKNIYENYQKQKFDKLTGNDKIKLVVKAWGNAARYIKEYDGAKWDNLTILENGEIIFTKDTSFTSEIIKWILGFGSEVTVIEPEFLREIIKKEAANIIERYKV